MYIMTRDVIKRWKIQVMREVMIENFSQYQLMSKYYQCNLILEESLELK